MNAYVILLLYGSGKTFFASCVRLIIQRGNKKFWYNWRQWTFAKVVTFSTKRVRYTIDQAYSVSFLCVAHILCVHCFSSYIAPMSKYISYSWNISKSGNFNHFALNMSKRVKYWNPQAWGELAPQLLLK